MRLRVATVVCFSLCLALVLTGCDWQMRLGGIDHGSTTRDDQLTASGVANLRAKWRVADSGCAGGGSGAGFVATPVTFKGVVYIGGLSGCLYAINESDGSRQWSRFMGYRPTLTCPARGIGSSANVQDDGNGHPVVYVHAPDGYLYKLDGTNGSVLWKSVVRIPSSTVSDVYAWSSPTVANGRVIVGVSSDCGKPHVQGQVRAYNATTGALLWMHKTIPDGYTGAGDWHDAAVDAHGDVYVTTGSTDTSVSDAHPNTENGFEHYSRLKLNGATGALIWKAPAPVLSLFNPDYGSSPILFTGKGVGLVGATNKDGVFRVYRQDNGAAVWQAQVGTYEDRGEFAALSGGVFDGTRLFVMGNTTTTGGSWKKNRTGTWTAGGGTNTPGSIRQLDPATGNIVRIGGQPFEVALPSNPLGPCSLNANALLVCAGTQWFAPRNGHSNGLFVVDTTRPPAVLRHLEDGGNYPQFAQPIQENGAILAATTHELVKWAP
jgi:outer membrane protein assembly factor BamB